MSIYRLLRVLLLLFFLKDDECCEQPVPEKLIRVTLRLAEFFVQILIISAGSRETISSF